MEHGKSKVKQPLMREIDQLMAIRSEPKITNETLKKFKIRGEVGCHEYTYAE